MRRARSGLLDNAFAVSVALKGLFALAELIAGALLLAIGHDTILGLVRWMTAPEITQDPTDFFAGLLMAAAGRFTIEDQHFFGLYLLAHAAIKIALVWALATRRYRLFPAALAVLAAFLTWQVVRFFQTGAAGLLALSAFDIFLIVVVWMEYLRHRTPTGAGRRELS